MRVTLAQISIPLLVVALHVSYVAAVKDYLFKNCENSGFCHRNKHYADQISSLGSEYKSDYSIDANSVEVISGPDKFFIQGQIVKVLPNLPEEKVVLPLKISVLEGNNIRIQVDEAKREAINIANKFINHQRYNETSNWAFVNQELQYVKTEDADLKKSDTKFSITYGKSKEYVAELEFYPIKLTVYHLGEAQVVVNDRGFLNVEHWRPKDANADHLSPQESDFNMFQDDFKDSKEDSLPLGPESIGLDFTFKNFRNLYGIPEHADTLNLKDTTESNNPYRLFNVDIFEYETDSRLPMYGSIPLLLAVKPALSVGLFWINSADTFINVDKSNSTKDSKTHWVSENGVIDFIILIGSTPAEINKNYGAITGYTQLPPLFSLGYHQCRWNYNDEKDVLDINSLMDQHQIPYDTIWLDIEYTDSKKYFTWQEDKFPDPEGMLKELDLTGRNLVVIIDPHIKTGYDVSNQLEKKKICMNDPSNSSYHGHCWPGESVWIDTLNPSSQSFWDSKFSWDKKNKFTGGESTNLHLWNDMNEPSVFNGPETSSPKDNLHYGGWEHRSVHNIYGLSFHEATFNSLVKRLDGHTRERPFVLTRSYFAGSQRTAAMWTGDNMSKWEYLKISIPMILTSNVVGMPFSGADVGGFFGNPSKELLTRWYQTGIWYPFFRAHAHIDSRRREPWVPGEPYTSVIREALNLRYSLLPVFYTAFYESSTNGSPIMKPIFYESLNNLESYSIEDQFFIGSSGLMVKPVTDENANDITIYIPDTEIYYDFTNGDLSKVGWYNVRKPGYIRKDVTLHDIPVLIKGGHIIARKERYRRSTKLMANDPYTIVVALDKYGHAEGNIYIDDGESFGYSTSGESINVHIKYSKDGLTAHVNGSNKEYINSLGNIGIEKIIIISPFKLIIENPKLKINSDWSIQIILDIEHDEL
ncbi:glucosidase II [Scheffersomyces xylosifermentans]|uniref:glucosidase II n=1 Tax=Scheffersomyces xylosifermentans TaxID=1304137 RepID=UPI00315D8403